MTTDFFTAVFSAINHWFGAAVEKTSDGFSIIYNFVIIFVKRVYSKLNKFSNVFSHFVVHCPKTKLET